MKMSIHLYELCFHLPYTFFWYTVISMIYYDFCYYYILAIMIYFDLMIIRRNEKYENKEYDLYKIDKI